MNRSVRYQVMPPLSPDEYQELHDDIKANGVLVPVIEDENGVLIDGHHRQKIAFELGVPCPVEIIEGKSEAEKRGMAFTLNLKRRHLNREQRRALIAESLKQDPQLSNREHARRTGASDKTIQSVREDAEANAEIPHYDSNDRVEASGRQARGAASQPPRVTSDVSETPNNPEPEPVSDFINREQLDELNKPSENTLPPVDNKPRRTPITDDANRIGWDIRKATEKLDRLTEDDRWSQNIEKVTPMLRGHLQEAIQIYTRILTELEGN